MKLPEEKLKEIDRIIVAFNMKMALILAEHPEWENFPHIISGLMVIICAGREDVLNQVHELVTPMMKDLAESARVDLVKKNLEDRRN